MPVARILDYYDDIQGQQPDFLDLRFVVRQPTAFFFENLIGLFTVQDGIFLRWFRNSLLYAGSITLGSILICATCGYAFSKYDFPYKAFIVQLSINEQLSVQHFVYGGI